MDNQSRRRIGRIGLVVGLLCSFYLLATKGQGPLSGIAWLLGAAGYVIYIILA